MIVKNQSAMAAALSGGLILLGASLFSASAVADPMRIVCALTGKGGDDKSASRTLTIDFDAKANTLATKEGGRIRKFGNVTISTVSINGATDDTTIGVDRSSWSIVVQTYAQDRVTSVFGACKPETMAKP